MMAITPDASGLGTEQLPPPPPISMPGEQFAAGTNDEQDGGFDLNTALYYAAAQVIGQDAGMYVKGPQPPLGDPQKEQQVIRAMVKLNHGGRMAGAPSAPDLVSFADQVSPTGLERYNVGQLLAVLPKATLVAGLNNGIPHEQILRAIGGYMLAAKNGVNQLGALAVQASAAGDFAGAARAYQEAWGFFPGNGIIATPTHGGINIQSRGADGKPIGPVTFKSAQDIYDDYMKITNPGVFMSVFTQRTQLANSEKDRAAWTAWQQAELEARRNPTPENRRKAEDARAALPREAWATAESSEDRAARTSILQSEAETRQAAAEDLADTRRLRNLQADIQRTYMEEEAAREAERARLEEQPPSPARDARLAALDAAGAHAQAKLQRDLANARSRSGAPLVPAELNMLNAGERFTDALRRLAELRAKAHSDPDSANVNEARRLAEQVERTRSAFEEAKARYDAAAAQAGRRAGAQAGEATQGGSEAWNRAQRAVTDAMTGTVPEQLRGPVAELATDMTLVGRHHPTAAIQAAETLFTTLQNKRTPVYIAPTENGGGTVVVGNTPFMLGPRGVEVLTRSGARVGVPPRQVDAGPTRRTGAPPAARDTGYQPQKDTWPPIPPPRPTSSIPFSGWMRRYRGPNTEPPPI